ncbi:MAG TPA: hypothetical protein VHA52_13205, partial [Candidatus Babeliaceae bacterium]|nr:hypothetical protein [Candidatus Babeliaceae bacterium]
WETLNISPMVIGSFFNGYFSLVDKTNSEVIISNISKLCNSVSVNCPKRFTPSWESIRTYLRDNIRLSIQKQMQETDTQFQNLIDCPTENSDVIYPKVFQRAIPFWHSHYGL